MFTQNLKWLHLAKKIILFRNDNPPVHTSVVVMTKINELKFKLFSYSAFSPHLNPSDHRLFPSPKNGSEVKKIGGNEEVINTANAYSDELGDTPYKNGIRVPL